MRHLTKIGSEIYKDDTHPYIVDYFQTDHGAIVHDIRQLSLHGRPSRRVQLVPVHASIRSQRWNITNHRLKTLIFKNKLPNPKTYFNSYAEARS